MKLLSLCPRIRKLEGKVVVTTSLWWRLGLLGTALRRVEILPKQKRILVASRYGWFFSKQRTLRFSQITAVTYGYEDMASPSLSWGHDSFDCFSVGLRLMDDTEMHLFHFWGEGTFTNDGPLPDWMYWDEYVSDMSGSQEQESRAFVDLLANLTKTKVVPPRGF